MSRSLHQRLHRRYGTRVSGAERRRRAAAHHERARDALPLDLLSAPPRGGSAPGRVAIVGAGFAGCAAGWLASRLGFDVAIYDAVGIPGGRVRSSRQVVPGRILEEGAELIGLNHPVWVRLAELAGFALTVVTPEDQQGGGLFESPLVLGGRRYDSHAQQKLYERMNEVLDAWAEESRVVGDAWAPWEAHHARKLDSHTLAEKIPRHTDKDVVSAIETEFELNNTVPISQQSWLANLAQFQAGGGKKFFDDTEVFRCAAGNQQLAAWLADGLPLVRRTVTGIDTSDRVWLRCQDDQNEGPFDYVVVATSVAIWRHLQVDGEPFPFPAVQHGPAIKYLAPVDERFWISERLSPSGMSDVLGMTWEGTDNQADTAGFDVSVFAGGSAALRAIEHRGSNSYFARHVSKLYPGFATSGGTFVNWPDDPAIQTGYSCPAPGEVVGAQRSYVSPYNGCLFAAGEHTSAAWFGFMEGALESGIVAAARVAEAAGA